MWAKVFVVGGLLLLAAGFGLGAEPSSTSVGHHSYECASVVPSTWLVAGTSGESSPPPKTALDRRVAAQCESVVRRNEVLTWGALGVGGLVLLVGWTALRERERPARRPAVAVTT